MRFKTLLLILFFGVLSFTGFSQNHEKVKDDFVKTFITGEPSLITAYFEGFASLQIPGHSGLFPATRSKIYFEAFMRNHPTETFLLKKSGFSGDNFYLIGLLESKSVQWDVYFLFSPSKVSYVVQQIEIEKAGK